MSVSHTIDANEEGLYMTVFRVHFSPAVLERLRKRAEQLPTGARVRVTLDDGQSVRGIVACQPKLESGQDASDMNGQYALLTLQDDNGTPLLTVYLDRVIWIESLAKNAKS